MAQIAKFEIEEKVKSSPHIINDFFEQNSSHSGSAPQARSLFGAQAQPHSGAQARGLFCSSRPSGRGRRAKDVTKLSFNLEIGGMSVTMKIEAVNCGGKTLTFSLVEGDMCKYYKSFKMEATFINNRIKWSIEYEEVDYPGSKPDYNNIVLLVKELTKLLESNLFKY